MGACISCPCIFDQIFCCLQEKKRSLLHNPRHFIQLNCCLQKYSPHSFSMRTILELENSWPYLNDYTIFMNKSFTCLWQWTLKKSIKKPDSYHSFRRITLPGESSHHPYIRSILSSMSTAFFLVFFFVFFPLSSILLHLSSPCISALSLLLDASDMILFQQWFYLFPLPHEHCQLIVIPLMHPLSLFDSMHFLFFKCL